MGSVRILAALVDSLVNIAGAFNHLLVVCYSLPFVDQEHAFGHAKAEPLAVQRYFCF